MNERKDETALDRDNTFLERLKSGDREAFRTLVEVHQDMVYNLALRMVRDRELAEDLSQEVFIKVYKALPFFRHESSLSTWIYRITYNAALTELKKARYRYERSTTEEVRIERRAPGITEVSDHDPYDVLDQLEVAENVGRLIEKLKPDQKCALTLYYAGEKSYREISDIMEIPMGTVKTLLFRAKEALRSMLTEEKP